MKNKQANKKTGNEVKQNPSLAQDCWEGPGFCWVSNSRVRKPGAQACVGRGITWTCSQMLFP